MAKLGLVVKKKNNGKRNVLMIATQPTLLDVTKYTKKEPDIYKFHDYTKGVTDSVDYRMGVNTVKTKLKRWGMSVGTYLLLLATMRVNA